MWFDLKEYTPVLKEDECIAIFKSKEAAEDYCEHKKLQDDDNADLYSVGEYIDYDTDISVRCS